MVRKSTATYKGEPLIKDTQIRPLTSLERYRKYLIKEKVIDDKGKLCTVNNPS